MKYSKVFTTYSGYKQLSVKLVLASRDLSKKSMKSSIEELDSENEYSKFLEISFGLSAKLLFFKRISFRKPPELQFLIFFIS